MAPQKRSNRRLESNKSRRENEETTDTGESSMDEREQEKSDIYGNERE